MFEAAGAERQRGPSCWAAVGEGWLVEEGFRLAQGMPSLVWSHREAASSEGEGEMLQRCPRDLPLQQGALTAPV